MVARQLITDAEAFAATARLWTQNFASQALALSQNAKVRPLGTVALARGLPFTRARAAFKMRFCLGALHEVLAFSSVLARLAINGDGRASQSQRCSRRWRS